MEENKSVETAMEAMLKIDMDKLLNKKYLRTYPENNISILQDGNRTII